MNGPRALSAVLVALMVSGLLSQAPAGAEPTRILLVGDSIAEGTTGDTAYRCDLWNLLAPGSVDFVGDRSSAGDCSRPGFDADHDGRGGATTA